MEIGQTYTNSKLVTAEMLAVNVGSGDVPVLATPAMIALMENAAMLCVSDSIPADSTTVGGHMNCSHLHPTAEHQTIKATATLEAIEGRKLTFHVVASDDKGMISEGTHVRFVVSRERFMSNLQK